MKKGIALICIFILFSLSVLNVFGAVVKDVVPPMITQALPANGAGNVSIHSGIQVSFNEVLIKGSSFANIALTDTQGKAVTANYSIKNNQLIGVLANKLKHGTEYMLTIPAGAIKDKSGNATAKAVSVKFKTLAVMPLETELQQMVSGIGKVAVANSGILELTDNQWLPIVSGNNFPAKNVFAAARRWGEGRILALGKDDVLNTANINILDNMKFIKNAIKWLNDNGSGGKRIGFSIGHNEFITAETLGGLKQELEKDQYTIGASKLTGQDLKNKDILIVGNAWSMISAEETTAVEEFVKNGGGLLLAGLGWSFEAYHPGKVYPMDLLGAKYGVQWKTDEMAVSSEVYKDAAVLTVFFPNIREDAELKDYMGKLTKLLKQHPEDLYSVLQKDPALYKECMDSFTGILQSLGSSPAISQEIYDFCKETTAAYPQYFSKEKILDAVKYPRMSWFRERFIKLWMDSLPLTAVSKAEIANNLSLTGDYKKIWEKYTIYIADNKGLDKTQTNQIFQVLSMVPDRMHNIRIISVAELLGEKPAELDAFTGFLDGINIFKFPVIYGTENSFPEDIDEGNGDLFTLVLIHEINHVVDASAIESNPLLNERKKQLLSKAGNTHTNYLRSMFEDGFFANAPQEFFASMSNEWFVDSVKTVELGLARFDKKINQPINQALYFAEVYSKGGTATCFYNMDALGNLNYTVVPLTRDVKGRINGFKVGGKGYSFDLDSNGDVTGYAVNKL